MSQFQESCKPIIAWLEAQYAVSNHYPEVLPSEIQDKLKTINRHSTYSAYGDKDNYFALLIGDYSANGWVYIWDSQDKRWHIDN